MDLQKAFTYFLKDINWKKKYFIGALLLFPVVFSTVFNNIIHTNSNPPNIQILTISIIVSLIGIAFSLFISGYFLVNCNLRIYKEAADLPEWSNWKLILKTSLKTLGASILYGLIYFALLIVSIVVLTIIVVPLFSSASKIILPILIGISFVILLIGLMILLIAAAIAFSTNLKFSSFFNFKLIFSIITKNKFKFFVLLLVYLALYILSSIVNFFLMKSIILAVLVPFINFYITLAISELVAQFIRCE